MILFDHPFLLCSSHSIRLGISLYCRFIDTDTCRSIRICRFFFVNVVLKFVYFEIWCLCHVYVYERSCLLKSNTYQMRLYPLNGRWYIDNSCVTDQRNGSHFTNLHTVRRFYHDACRSSNEPAFCPCVPPTWQRRPICILTIGIFVDAGNKITT